MSALSRATVTFMATMSPKSRSMGIDDVAEHADAGDRRHARDHEGPAGARAR